MSIQDTMRALNDPTRREILSLLRQNVLTAGEITEQFEISNASISHHLSILKHAGLILDDKRGKYIYYEINTSVLDEVLEWFQALRKGTTHETE